MPNGPTKRDAVPAAAGAVLMLPALVAALGVLPEWIVLSIPGPAWMILVFGGVPLGLGLVLVPLTRRLATGWSWWVPLAILVLGWVLWWNWVDPLGSDRGAYSFFGRGGFAAIASGCVTGLLVNLAALYAPVLKTRDN